MTTRDLSRCPLCGGAVAAADMFVPVRLLHCSRCRFVFRPTAQDAPNLYGPHYWRRYADEEARAYEAQVRLDLVRSHRASGRLIEVGCGTGHFLEAAWRAGFDVAGVEPSEVAADQSSRRVSAEIYVGTIEDVRLSAASADVVCAFHVLEHLTDPLAALGRMRETLAHGGHLFVEVPNIESVRARRDRERWFHLDPAHHACHFSPSSLQEALNRAGFKIVRMTTIPAATYRRFPRSLLSYGKLMLKDRTVQFGEHPSRHELLRAIAQRP